MQSADAVAEAAVLREELGLLVIELRQFAKGLRDLPSFMDLDPNTIADQIEDLIGGN